MKRRIGGIFHIRVLPEIALAALLLLLTISAAVQVVLRNWPAPAAGNEAAPIGRTEAQIATVRSGESRLAAASGGPGSMRSWKDPAPLSPEDPRRALDSLVGDNSPETDDSFREKVREWTETNPAAAAAWAAGLKEGPHRSKALEQVAITWSDAELPAAAAWLHSLPEDQSKPNAVLAFAYEAARADPRAALQETSTLEATPERDQALLHAVSQWSAADSASALAWSMQVGDPALRERLVSEVAIAAAESSPESAAKLASLAIEPGPQQENTAVAIVQRWAQISPQAAADWVLQFPDTPARIAAAENLAAIWAERDLAGLGEWASGLPSGPLREIALGPYEDALARQAATVRK